jgi:hypothetical protein
MKNLWIGIVLAGVLITGCQPAETPTQELPTLAVLPSLTPAEAVTTTAPPPTATAESSTATTAPPEATPTDVPTRAAATATTAATPLPPTVTIVIRQEVFFATLTPVPAGVNAPLRTTPVIMADAVITESDFQRALDTTIAPISSIQFARVDFVPGGVWVELTALGGAAFITGQVQVLIEMSGSFATLSIGEINVNAAAPPQTFLDTVNGDFFSAFVQAFDAVLSARVGPNHDLENIVLNNEAMQVFLLVPQG